MTHPEREQLRALFSRALLGVVAPCGVFFAHGSPNDRLQRLSDLDDISFPPPRRSYHDLRVADAASSQPAPYLATAVDTSTAYTFDATQVAYTIGGLPGTLSGLYLTPVP